jgi:hypothetical protein
MRIKASCFFGLMGVLLSLSLADAEATCTVVQHRGARRCDVCHLSP